MNAYDNLSEDIKKFIHMPSTARMQDVDNRTNIDEKYKSILKDVLQDEEHLDLWEILKTEESTFLQILKTWNIHRRAAESIKPDWPDKY